MSDIKVGQAAAIRRRGEHVFGYTVTKVTPTGQVTITGSNGGTRRFNRNGREIGGSTYGWTRLITGDAKLEEAKLNAAKLALIEAKALDTTIST